MRDENFLTPEEMEMLLREDCKHTDEDLLIEGTEAKCMYCDRQFYAATMTDSNYNREDAIEQVLHHITNVGRKEMENMTDDEVREAYYSTHISPESFTAETLSKRSKEALDRIRTEGRVYLEEMKELMRKTCRHDLETVSMENNGEAHCLICERRFFTGYMHDEIYKREDAVEQLLMLDPKTNRESLEALSDNKVRKAYNDLVVSLI